MSRPPEEATCKHCPHWGRIKEMKWGECFAPTISEGDSNDFVYSDHGIETGEDATCIRHPYWREE